MCMIWRYQTEHFIKESQDYWCLQTVWLLLMKSNHHKRNNQKTNDFAEATVLAFRVHCAFTKNQINLSVFLKSILKWKMIHDCLKNTFFPLFSEGFAKRYRQQQQFSSTSAWGQNRSAMHSFANKTLVSQRHSLSTFLMIFFLSDWKTFF